MSYTFLPPRIDNYFPRGMPYLAGVRGLGDYAADLEAWKKEQAYYQADYKRWAAEKAKYDVAIADYNRAMSGMAGSYASAHARYLNDKGQWDNEYKTYIVAIQAYNAQMNSIRAQNKAKAQQVAKSYGLSLPSSFLNGDACITQAQKDAYMKACRTNTVKGLGSVSSDCGMAALAVCSFPAKPTLRAMPQEPVKPTPPPRPTLRAQPTPPTTPKPTPPAVVTTTPTSTPTTTPTSTPSQPITTDLTPEDGKQANLVMGGLIVAAVLGGGYLVYRTLKKPKAQAA